MQQLAFDRRPTSSHISPLRAGSCRYAQDGSGTRPLLPPLRHSRRQCSCTEQLNSAQLYASPDTAAPENASSGQSLTNGFRVRRARETDTRLIADLCAEVFGPLAFRGFPSYLRSSKQLQYRASQEIWNDVDTQLLRAITNKRKAQQEAREFRLQQLSCMMRAELARIAGRPSFCNPEPSVLQRQALRRWQRNRKFVCLVALPKGAPSRAAGCAVVSMSTPEAFFPPPWPSRAALRCCVSNVAVAGDFRRQGLARRLLESCETVARRWGHEDLWLHTEVSNGVAQQLYSSLGYREVKRDPRFFGPFRRILLRKTLPARRSGGSRGPQPADLQAGGRTRDGAYVWDVAQE